MFTPMLESLAPCTQLSEGEALERQHRNTAYLLELDPENLLFPFRFQAGLLGSINKRLPLLHGGWDAQTSHIRGTFTGHWLSAAAHIYAQTKGAEFRTRCEYLVSQLRLCQESMGGSWVFPIPPEYIEGVKQGRYFWAPFYVCHKVMMGLLDVYRLVGIPAALEIIDHASDWFVDFLHRTSRKELDEMMDIQETGGIMELWADLYGLTGAAKYLQLLRGFERPRLFEPLLAGSDVLTNMHANTTIPEAHGAARAYEVTGEDRYRKIAESYWKQAVTLRGSFVTGGQTSGEVWTPPMIQASRLGELTQEHCTVYNMIRLADYLYRLTGEREYADYIESNIINGLFAQAFWKGRSMDCVCNPDPADTGIVSYYLPLGPGSQKKWGSKFDHFWCCHCTAVQANSRLHEFIWHKSPDGIVLSQFIPSELCEEGVRLTLRETDTAGNCNRINPTANTTYHRPRSDSYDITISAPAGKRISLRIRIPAWTASAPVCTINGEAYNTVVRNGFLPLPLCGDGDTVHLELPKALRCYPLPDVPDMAAFLDGPVALAGLTAEERTLYGDIERPETILTPYEERQWGQWTGSWKTSGQPVNFILKPLWQIGREQYTVYFPIRKPGSPFGI